MQTKGKLENVPTVGGEQ